MGFSKALDLFGYKQPRSQGFSLEGGRGNPGNEVGLQAALKIDTIRNNLR